MSITLIGAIYDRGPDKPAPRAVLQALAYYIKDDQLMTNPTCWPSFKTLADRTALSVPTVKRVVKELADDGWLSATPRTRENGALTSNLYRLNIARILNDDTYPSITMILGSITETPASITMTLPQYHHDTTLVSPRYDPSITVIRHDPVIEQEEEQEREQGERKRARARPVVVSRAVDRTPGGNGYRPPPDEPIPGDDEPAMVRDAPAAVRLIWRITTHWPPLDLHDWLAEAMGDAPDEQIFRRVWLEWRKRGYKPTNYEGLIEWYREAISVPNWQAPQFNGNGRQPAKPTAPIIPAMKEVTPGSGVY